MPVNFVHLHNHSEYSLLDGACRVGDLASKAAEMDMPAIALTDHGAMHGVVEFYTKCQAKGVKPIIGCEVYVAPRHRKGRDSKLDASSYHLVLLAKNDVGYRNLLKICSTGHLEGFYYKPKVDKEILNEYREGLVCLSACLAGEVADACIEKKDQSEARNVAALYREIYGRENFFLEIQDHGLKEQQALNEYLAQMSEQMDIPLVATNDIHFLRKQDHKAHDVLLCIQTGSTVDNPNRFRFGSDAFYLKTAEEMAQTFPWALQALENTLLVADMCDVKFDFTKTYLPRYEVPDGYTMESYLEALCWKNLEQRYGQITPILDERLRYEMGIINSKGFAAYFLIVWDYVSYAKNNGISVGPGRGSAAGSLVAYVLGITNLDPLKYGLMFERFLNPDRITMPDIDIDFSPTKRDRMIQYVREKYGADRVAQIATFGTMKARAAVRDAGRALNMAASTVDRVAKLIPAHPGINVTIEDALNAVTELKSWYGQDEEVKNLLDVAQTIEGMTRHASTHAAGVVISQEPLTTYAPLMRSGESEGGVTIQFDKKIVEKIGLLKMDFLGLITLDVIEDCLKLIQDTAGETLDIDAIPLDDPKTYQLLIRGEGVGVFQLESSGMRKLMKDLAAEKIDDVIALIALYRPALLQTGMVEDFVRRKHGSTKITYLHPSMEPILKDTYGVILYQEQAMQMAIDLASFTPGQADSLRSAMSKKQHEVIEKLRVAFVDGSEKNGIPRDTAEKIYDLMASFGSYGFNKSHSAAYGIVSYQTAYLKANYPAHFMAALLTSEIGDKTKVVEYIEECKRMGLEVLPPEINRSDMNFSVDQESGAIRFGLAAIKNVPKGSVEVILNARASGGPFASLFDFCSRTEAAGSVGKSVCEMLVKAGTFGSLCPNRNQLLCELEDALALAARQRKDKESGQTSLFGMADDSPAEEMQPVSRASVRDFGPEEILAFEKDLLGLYISDHPLSRYRQELGRRTTVSAESLPEQEDNKMVVVGGIITHTRQVMTKKNQQMMMLVLEDFTGPMNVTVFPSAYESFSKHLQQDQVLLIKGKTSHRDRLRGGEEDQVSYDVEIVCEEVIPLKLPENNGNGNGNGAVHAMHIRVASQHRSQLPTLKAMLANSPGSSPVYFHINTSPRPTKVAASLSIDPTPRLLQDVSRVVGDGMAWVD
ncbi:MAG: DNA polymerase III subunit alpha [Armatimonadetes bacterium]|nr:DNA polymerase III subunit alpha [Armatimonadota bacterium]